MTGPVQLLGPVQVRELAESLGLRPTKRLGQNFVIDPNTVRRIVRAAGVGADDRVVEIGPGLGSLTLGLLEHGSSVVAVEVDPILAGQLPATVRDRASAVSGRVDVVTADALDLVRDDLPGPEPTALVANLPYNVAVPVLLRALEVLPTVQRILVMVQAEVADRLAAEPGSRTYGVPSVKARWYADVSRAGAVGRSVFWPSPRVDSGLVRLIRRPPPQLCASREATFAVVDAAFAQRRKTLRAALSGWAGSAAAAEARLRAAGIEPSLRGEDLDIAAFVAIAGTGPPSPDSARTGRSNSSPGPPAA
jgi:16S rRNA (adenine1518-N6/adenine1519-N6)-dimethyltransferase